MKILISLFVFGNSNYHPDNCSRNTNVVIDATVDEIWQLRVAAPPVPPVVGPSVLDPSVVDGLGLTLVPLLDPLVVCTETIVILKE